MCCRMGLHDGLMGNGNERDLVFLPFMQMGMNRVFVRKSAAVLKIFLKISSKWLQIFKRKKNEHV